MSGPSDVDRRIQRGIIATWAVELRRLDQLIAQQRSHVDWLEYEQERAVSQTDMAYLNLRESHGGSVSWPLIAHATVALWRSHQLRGSRLMVRFDLALDQLKNLERVREQFEISIARVFAVMRSEQRPW